MLRENSDATETAETLSGDQRPSTARAIPCCPAPHRSWSNRLRLVAIIVAVCVHPNCEQDNKVDKDAGQFPYRLEFDAEMKWIDKAEAQNCVGG